MKDEKKRDREIGGHKVQNNFYNGNMNSEVKLFFYQYLASKKLL